MAGDGSGVVTVIIYFVATFTFLTALAIWRCAKAYSAAEFYTKTFQGEKGHMTTVFCTEPALSAVREIALAWIVAMIGAATLHFLLLFTARVTS